MDSPTGDATVAVWHPGVVLSHEQLTPEIIAAIKAALTPAQVLGLTSWAEARSRFDQKVKHWFPNPIDALVDIQNVVDNRVKDPRWAALGHKGVCLQRRQFSCWDTLGGADNFYALMNRAQRVLAGEQMEMMIANVLAAAEGCVTGALVDSLNGATHYYANTIAPPAWAAPPAIMTDERWGHRFFKNVK